MKSIFKYASALLLGAVGMYIALNNGGTYISDEEFEEYQATKENCRTLYQNWKYEFINSCTSSELDALQKGRLSDIIRAAADNGCHHVIEAARDFGCNWELLSCWGLPDWYHDITVSVDSLNNWVFCY